VRAGINKLLIDPYRRTRETSANGKWGDIRRFLVPEGRLASRLHSKPHYVICKCCRQGETRGSHYHSSHHARSFASAGSVRTGASISLAWDPSPDPAVTGYHVYYGAAPGLYTNKVSVGSARSIGLDLLGGATYYFAATASTASGLESPPPLKSVLTCRRRWSTIHRWRTPPVGSSRRTPRPPLP